LACSTREWSSTASGHPGVTLHDEKAETRGLGRQIVRSIDDEDLFTDFLQSASNGYVRFAAYRETV
jgi:hypothetical protein